MLHELEMCRSFKNLERYEIAIVKMQNKIFQSIFLSHHLLLLWTVTLNGFSLDLPILLEKQCYLHKIKHKI